MAIRLPEFNITCDIWRPPDAPPGPATFTNVACQLYIYSRTSTDIKPTVLDTYQPTIMLRVPMGTDLQVDDVVEAASGDGWFYTVRFTDRMHRGFPNEYFMGILEQQTTAPPSGSSIITEGSDPITTEAGDKLITET
jgi:hypothetical protein